jgi:hypothetical protein
MRSDNEIRVLQILDALTPEARKKRFPTPADLDRFISELCECGRVKPIVNTVPDSERRLLICGPSVPICNSEKAPSYLPPLPDAERKRLEKEQTERFYPKAPPEAHKLIEDSGLAAEINERLGARTNWRSVVMQFWKERVEKLAHVVGSNAEAWHLLQAENPALYQLFLMAATQ